MWKMRHKALGNLPKVTQLKYGSQLCALVPNTTLPLCIAESQPGGSCFLISGSVEFLGCIPLLQISNSMTLPRDAPPDHEVTRIIISHTWGEMH